MSSWSAPRRAISSASAALPALVMTPTVGKSRAVATSTPVPLRSAAKTGSQEPGTSAALEPWVTASLAWATISSRGGPGPILVCWMYDARTAGVRSRPAGLEVVVLDTGFSLGGGGRRGSGRPAAGFFVEGAAG